MSADADGRNAVVYGERAIDRSPCGIGTSGSRFIGRVEEAVDVGGVPGIIPSIEGSAIATGFNTLWIDPRRSFRAGFSVV